MRDSLSKLIEEVIIFEYDLPNDDKGIVKTIFSTLNDKCYSSVADNGIIEIIYNSILEYSFNEFDLDEDVYQAMHSRALQIKLRYDESADDENKIKYGFYGEVLLYAILYVLHSAKPLISRGYFFNPLENSEAKGFDSYHLVEVDDKVELWFGESKFRQSFHSSIKEVLDNINHAISDEYLNKNILAMVNHKDNFNIKDTKIEKIVRDIEKNTSINIIDSIKKHNMKLVYPVFICFDKAKKDYDDVIRAVLKYITKHFKVKDYNISIDYSIFFILLPVENVKEIKLQIINWISTKRALLP